MGYTIQRPIEDKVVEIFNPVAGTPTGSKGYIYAPFRGWITECGFMPNSLVASAITLAVSLGTQASSTASNFTQIVTSTLGTFSSTVLMEGAPCSVIPSSQFFVNAGDAIQMTTSGGNTSAIGATLYAVIRRG